MDIKENTAYRLRGGERVNILRFTGKYWIGNIVGHHDADLWFTDGTSAEGGADIVDLWYYSSAIKSRVAKDKLAGYYGEELADAFDNLIKARLDEY